MPFQAATIRPNAYSLIAIFVDCYILLPIIPGIQTIMTQLRLVLLATTALTAMQFAAPASHAQTAPMVVAQAKEELGPDGKPKPKPAPPAVAPRPRAAGCRATAAEARAAAAAAGPTAAQSRTAPAAAPCGSSAAQARSAATARLRA